MCRAASLLEASCSAGHGRLAIGVKMLRFLSALVVPLTLVIATPAFAVTSAELYRTTAHRYGKFEARIQFAPGDGVISSFFLWKDGSELSSVYWNELDFEKVGGACDLQTNSIYGLPQSNHEGVGYGLTGLCDGYHTYAYQWTPEYIAWFVDGTEIRRDTGADAAAYADSATEGMQFRFNIWPGNASFGGSFSESTLPLYQFVAWAQYSEFTPGAGDGGSDFTVAWREEFDSQPAGWAMGSWASPLNGSTHSAQNVVFADGVLVLALTADDAPGYVGTPPPDTDGPVASATGGAGGAVTPSTGGADAPTTDGSVGPSADDGGEGCSCRLAPNRSSRWGAVALLSAAVLGWLGRRRRRAAGFPARARYAGAGQQASVRS